MENTIEEMKNVRDKAVALYESRCDVHSSQNFAALLAAMDLLLSSHRALLKGRVEELTHDMVGIKSQSSRGYYNRGFNAAIGKVLALLK